jgi:cation diffusion facilitator CzcD-associated flavoprotein CzcO
VARLTAGFDTSRHIPFPVIGRNGKTIQSTYTPYPTTYLSVAVEGFPNWFQAYGPNGGTSTSGMLIMLEKQVEYAVTATLKLQRERLKSIEVKGESVVDFEEYMHVGARLFFSLIVADFMKTDRRSIISRL